MGSSGGGGIRIRPTGSGSSKVMVDNFRVESNATGVLVDGTATTGANVVTIRDSVISTNATFGLKATDSGGGSTSVLLDQSAISSNLTKGVVATGANATVRLANSTVTGNAKGLAVATSGKIISQGGIVVRGNTLNGNFTSTEAQQ